MIVKQKLPTFVVTNNSGALQALSLMANSDDDVLSHLNGLSMVCPFVGFGNADEA